MELDKDESPAISLAKAYRYNFEILEEEYPLGSVTIQSVIDALNNIIEAK